MTTHANAAQRARAQQRAEELCAAAIRALAGERDLQFRGRRLHRGGQRLPAYAPHLHPAPDEDNLASLRGAADGLALRLRHGNAALHAALRPADPGERLVFDLLEQLRCESLADAAHAGVRANLRQRFEAWSQTFQRSGLAETASGLLLYTLAQIARARLFDEPVVDAAEELIESTRYALAPRIGGALAGLRRTRAEPRVYARHALAIASEVGAMLRQAAEDDAAAGQGRSRWREAALAGFSLVLEAEGEGDAFGIAQPGDSRLLGGSVDGYRVYTRAYDRETRAATLLRAPVLVAHRERLDALVRAECANVPRLARALAALLAEPVVDGWDGGQEEGRIDGRRLAQLVASPRERGLFRADRIVARPDTALVLLLDCSGSMKAHAERTAVLADLMLRAADDAGLSTELLGFTTAAWGGGRAARDWQRAGRPPHPGRLAEQLHLVFKDAAQVWRRARYGVAALLEPTIYREGIDGEAVAWACARLRALPVRRRMLVVVSDGCPMERATEMANDAHYLDQHLRETVARESARGDVVILGLGVGLDLSPYYPRCRAVDLAATRGQALLNEVLQLLASPRRS